ncbi:unnamed protein product [Urochloa decumbens]|uniref:F-box domain-containing protein n=1 Tax=Urochloa decumbens TaxID=240449 RepID=A0ABC9FPK5_9POAL
MESSSLPLAPKHRRHKVDAPLADAGVLPTDVLHDVLLRLPAKALCRLRLVCKSWRSLISDPIFVATHTSGHPLVAGLHKGRLREVHIAELLSGNIVRRIRIPQDCKRLTTQLDVVCASAWYPLLYVTTLDRGEARPKWRVAPGPAVPVEPDSGSMAVVGGVAYFLHHDHLYVTGPASLDPDSIASFDLAAEEWRATPIRGPLRSLVLRIGGDKLSYNKDRKDFQLTELGGSLVTVHCKYQDKCLMYIWFLMDVEKGTWRKRYSVQREWEYNGYSFYPIVILEDGRIVMWIGYWQFMRAYDPRTSTWTSVMGSTRGMGMYVAVDTYNMLVC